ncbi:LemA family protein [Gynurincola endophyticus]|jgi:LemA protein|uniref:LemA family protein n=1 Tax=Gynurincola endophyticus TaxID=2479004 RepID=UPI000F8C6351|nr:LemA family protein [Gynurincola endophyticus]
MKPVGVIIAIVAVLLLWGGCQYNGMVGVDENVKKTWNNVESEYQRRSDLIPNLVNTVKGYANFEQKTLTDVIEARAKATSVNINADNLTPEKLAEFQQAQSQVSSSLSRLLVTVEQYPDLKANQNFMDLQKQLEGTENRIKVARNDFNAAVEQYNVKVRRFPANLFAGILGFQPKEGFKADPGANVAPNVTF